MDCGNLNDPVNGSVTHTSGTTFGQTATYTCNTGYNLVGDSTRTCEATGEWSGSAPTCEGMLLQLISFLSYLCTYTQMTLIGVNIMGQARASNTKQHRLAN